MTLAFALPRLIYMTLVQFSGVAGTFATRADPEFVSPLRLNIKTAARRQRKRGKVSVAHPKEGGKPCCTGRIATPPPGPYYASSKINRCLTRSG